MACLNSKKADAKDLRKELNITAHELTVEELYKLYNCDPVRGLTDAQVVESRAKYGRNSLTPPASMPWWLMYLNQYANFFCALLIAGGILCFVAYGLDPSDSTNVYLGAILIAVVVLSSTFGYFQEAKSAKIMEGFKNMIPKNCKVIRNGGALIVNPSELVPGDLCEFQDGDQTPADIRVTEASNMKVDNASLTGESEPCERGPTLQVEAGHGGHGNRSIPAIEATNLIFYSTLVVSGFGKGVVIGTGDNTVMGQIAGLAGEQNNQKPPIAVEVDRFISIISVIAIVIGATFMGVAIGLEVQTIVQSLVFAISVIVATVPEGLLVTMTVGLALTAKRMHSKNVLVKNLQSVETLGCTTVIASDKTGTLTQNRMTVQHCWYDGIIRDIPAAKNIPQLEEMCNNYKGHFQLFEPSSPSFKKLQMVAALCNNSEFMISGPIFQGPNKTTLTLAELTKSKDFNLLGLECTGDASESGLIKGVQLLRDVKEYRQANPKIFEIKFNSTNKWQLSIHKPEDKGAQHPLLVLKGAPERVIKLCSHILVNGEEHPMTQEHLDAFEEAYAALGSLGERVLGFAYKSMKDHTFDYPFQEKPEMNFRSDGLVFAGLLSLIDPPRIGVPEAVAKCKRASVKTFMVTGDHPVTAKAIALQIGIINEDKIAEGRGIVVTGDDLRVITELPTEDEQINEWDRVLSHEQIVFARVSPAHKLLICENAQRRGEVVAVTGDGVNDAPALKKANIGVAMGIAGKDVSKEAADMILMDDNFASIVNGVEEGRIIFENLRKSIMYTLTSKMPELIPFLAYITINIPVATTTILILIIDLGTDMMPAISMAYEKREANIMERPPRNAHTDHMVDIRLLVHTYLHIGLIQALGSFFTYMVVLNDLGYNPGVLLFTGLMFAKKPMLCTSENGKANMCGHACDSPKGNTLFKAREAMDRPYCVDGCQIPYPGTYDPFVEFTPSGFRGFGAGTKAACGRTCKWYTSLGPKRDEYLAAANSSSNPLRSILTPNDDIMFKAYCALPGSADFGFPGREAAFDKTKAPIDAFYWWNGRKQLWPNTKYQDNVLRQAQSAYFLAVVITKVTTLITTKTRKLSIFQHGMKNNFMCVAICFETTLALLLVFVPPLNIVFGTRVIDPIHLLPGIPFALFIFCYEEGRKFLMRKFPGGFVETYTFW